DPYVFIGAEGAIELDHRQQPDAQHAQRRALPRRRLFPRGAGGQTVVEQEIEALAAGRRRAHGEPRRTAQPLCVGLQANGQRQRGGLLSSEAATEPTDNGSQQRQVASGGGEIERQRARDDGSTRQKKQESEQTSDDAHAPPPSPPTAAELAVADLTSAPPCAA